MLKHPPDVAYAEAKMLFHQSKRKKRPTIIVEGNYDLKVFQKVVNTKLVNINSYKWPSNDNKGDLIKLVKRLDNLDKENNHQNYVVGVVDADCDLVIDQFYKSNFIPYAENVFDTSPFTDLNLLLTSRLNLEEYLSAENLSSSDFNNIYNVLAWFSAIRTLKKRFENLKKKPVFLHFSDMKQDLLEKDKNTPKTIEEFVEMLEILSRTKIRGYSNSPTKKFFDFIRNNNRLEKVLNMLKGGDVKYFQHVNGHDLSFSVRLFGRRTRDYQIEQRLINPENLDYLKQTKLFMQLREWGNHHHIEIF